MYRLGGSLCVDGLNISSTVSGFSSISASPKVIEKVSDVMHRCDAQMILPYKYKLDSRLLVS
jgi:hypothetical protein